MSEQTGQTIDITPSWRGILPGLLALIENSDAEGRSLAIEELRRMARLADKFVEITKLFPNWQDPVEPHI